MSEQDRAAKAKATKAANEAKRKEAMNEIVAELRVKYPQLEVSELERLARNQMKRRALDRQDQAVLNPRVNSKAETRSKVIMGAMLLTDSATDASARRLLAKYASQIKESDRKLYDTVLAAPAPAPSQLAELIVAHLIPETLEEALSSSSPRFTLTFGRDKRLLDAIQRLMPVAAPTAPQQS